MIQNDNLQRVNAFVDATCLLAVIRLAGPPSADSTSTTANQGSAISFTHHRYVATGRPRMANIMFTVSNTEQEPLFWDAPPTAVPSSCHTHCRTVGTRCAGADALEPASKFISCWYSVITTCAACCQRGGACGAAAHTLRRSGVHAAHKHDRRQIY